MLLACCCLRPRVMLAGGLRASLSMAAWTRRWVAGDAAAAAAAAAWLRVSRCSLCTASADVLASAMAASAAAAVAGLCGSGCAVVARTVAAAACSDAMIVVV